MRLSSCGPHAGKISFPKNRDSHLIPPGSHHSSEQAQHGSSASDSEPADFVHLSDLSDDSDGSSSPSASEADRRDLGGQFMHLHPTPSYHNAHCTLARKELESFSRLLDGFEKRLESVLPWNSLATRYLLRQGAGYSCKSTQLFDDILDSGPNKPELQTALQHTQDCHDCNDKDVTLLTQLFQHLLTPSTSLPEQPPPVNVAPPSGAHKLATQTTAASAAGNHHAFDRAGNGGQSDKSKGKRPLRETFRSDPNNDEDGDDDPVDRPSQKPNADSTKKGDLICPFYMSPRYRHLPECSRCLIARLPDMQALVQHVRRTHHYCLICRHKFASKDHFDAHIKQQDQCQRCHKFFGGSGEAHNHDCLTRPRQNERQRYRDIWDMVCPEEQCPAEYRTNHAVQYRIYSGVFGELRTWSDECKDSFLQLFRAVLERDPSLSGTERANSLGRLRRCLEPTLPMLGQTDDAVNDPATAMDLEISSQHNLLKIEASEEDVNVTEYSSDNFEPSQEGLEIPQHNLNPSRLSISQPFMSPDYLADNHTGDDLSGIQLLPDPAFQSSPAQDQGSSFMVDWCPHEPAYSSSYLHPYQGQPSSSRTQYSTHAWVNQNGGRQATTTQEDLPFYSSMATAPPMHGTLRHNHASVSPTYIQPWLQPSSQSRILYHDHADSSRTSQATGHPYGTDYQHTFAVNQIPGAPGQFLVPRTFNPSLPTPSQMPLLMSSAASFQNHNGSEDFYHPNEGSIEAPWVDNATMTDRNQNYQQLQRPDGRRYHEQQR